MISKQLKQAFLIGVLALGLVPIGNVRAQTQIYANRLVARQPDKYFAWPANDGVWQWGNEILIGFRRCKYDANILPHHCAQPNERMQARSTDGGWTWTLEPFSPSFRRPIPHGPLNLTHASFAFKVWQSEYYYSFDRGVTWEGPFALNVPNVQLSSRTDYEVVSSSKMKIFTAGAVDGLFPTRGLAIETSDAGQTFTSLGWMTSRPALDSAVPADCAEKNYTMMSSTVRTGANSYVSVLRKRICTSTRQLLANDVYTSTDDGVTWQEIARTAEGMNTPSGMVRLPDGRLVTTYAERVEGGPSRMWGQISSNNGASWGNPILLRDNGLEWDVGYPQSVALSNGNVVTMYYWATAQNSQQHIEATIWKP